MLVIEMLLDLIISAKIWHPLSTVNCAVIYRPQYMDKFCSIIMH